MANLLANDIGLNYKGLLNLDTTINTGLDGTLRVVTDGEGDSSPLYLSTTAIGLGTTSIWDNTNGRLGIGTTSPSYKLDVNQTSSAYSSRFLSSSGGGIILGAYNVDYGAIYTASVTPSGSNFMLMGSSVATVINGSSRIDAYLGHSTRLWTATATQIDIPLKVGVNNATPTAQLQIKGSGSTSATTSLLVQDSAGTQLMKLADDNGVVFGVSASSVNRARFGTYLQLKYDTPDIDIWQGGSGVGLRITQSGTLLAEFNDASGGGSKIVHSLNVGSNSFASASARLQVDSTTKGFLPPRMTTAEKNAIATPAVGLMVYDKDLAKLCVYTTAWETITSA